MNTKRLERGRPKLLHVQHASLPQLDAELRAHLQRDGLLP